MNRPFVVLVAGMLGIAGVRAAELGMEAPPLRIAHWVKGAPVDLGAGRGTHVTVVEFWATWCGPCRASIPHLTAMQKRFRDRGVTVVGVSDEEVGRVRPFVERMGEQMAYTVAVDDGEATTGAYMRAFGVEGIPHAFVIDREGRVAWRGHPRAGLEQAVEDILEGRHDIEAARRVMAAEKSMREYFQRAAEAGEPAEAREFGDRIVREGGSSAALLNTFSWVILTHPSIRHRDLELALRAARMAYERTEGKDASVADTYARALFETGGFKEAIAIQRRAVAVAADDAEREQLEKTLKEYEARIEQGGVARPG